MSSKDKIKLLSNEVLDDIYQEAWLGFDTTKIKIPDELGNIWKYDEPPGLVLARYIRKPENFGFLCSEIFNVKLMPFQLTFLKQMWMHKFPMLIGSRGFGKSFLLSLYSMMKAFLYPNHKVVVAGAGYRQSKHLFEYTKAIWARAPVLRSLAKGNIERSGPHSAIDRCLMQICDSRVTFLPIGGGGQIRGERAHTLIVDEFSVLPLQIYEVVLKGFTSTSPDPVGGAIEHKAREILQERYGIEPETIQGMGNQSIISGTCDYDFQHFATYWKRYKQIIESRGDTSVLSNIDIGLDESAILDVNDFCVIRFPVDLIPKGFMDAGSIVNAKATMHSSAYLCEYAACLAPDTYIITSNGSKFIKDIRIGDLVLTHRGRFRKVTNLMSRYIDNELIYKLRTVGYAEDILITPEHPVYQSNEAWDLVENIDKLYLSNLKELSSLETIKISDYVNNYIIKTSNKIEYIYPMWSKSKLSNEDWQYIESNEGILSAKEISTSIGCSRSIVYNAWKNKSNIASKSYINNAVSLDYDFGLIIGYYLSEGSVGANGKALGFALDGHVNTKLQTYVDKLSGAIQRVFGIIPKLYIKNSIINVSINRRLLVDFISKIVPGIAHNKYIIPEILYSNKDFLKGLVEGYWDGDGHWTIDRKFCSCFSVSLSLITQMKLILSAFGITSSIHIRKSSKSQFRGKDYQSKLGYVLCIYGYDACLFKNIFYGVPIDYNNDNGRNIKTYNNSVESVYNIKNKELVPYTGYVYNFEVEEDNSYSLLSGTVHNCFSNDSDGFFKRSLLESCVINEDAPAGTFPDDAELFEARVLGHPDRKYVYGIDPASENDNFSIVILELHQKHNRIVYCWTTSKKEHKAQLRAKLTTQQNFYAYVVRKVRQLMKTFPPARIGCDSQGGGVGVREAFYDEAHIEAGESPIYEIPSDDPKKPKDTDMKTGPHIIEFVNFAKSDWVTEANHGLRKDFEDKVLLFPYFDTASLEMAAMEDQQLEEEGKLNYDTLENCIWEIEELKSELATIVETKTAAQNRSRWDTPEIKLPNSKKGRMHKDRYSALLIANMVARTIHRTEVKPEYQSIGGFANTLAGKEDRSALMYTGPEAWVKGMQEFFS